MKTPELKTSVEGHSLDAVVRRDWSKDFNALPDEVRTIGAAMEAKTRIQHLTMEKERLKHRYDQSVSEINDYIKNCEQWLRRLEAPNAKIRDGEDGPK